MFHHLIYGSRLSRSVVVVVWLSLLLQIISLGFVDNTLAESLSLGTSTRSGGSSIFLNMETLDTQDFHQYAACAVELSNACVIGTGNHNNNKNNDQVVLSVERSVRDWDNDCRKSYLYQIPLFLGDDDDDEDDDDAAPNTQNTHEQPPLMIPPTLLDSSIVARLVSPSGRKTILIKKNLKNDEQKKKTNTWFLEIWEGASMIRRIHNNYLDQHHHGSIIVNDVTFGSPSWSSDETCLVYSAERLPPKTTSYWSSEEATTTTTSSSTGSTTTGTSSSTSTPMRGAQNVLGQGIAEDWGEKYDQQAPLLDLYILNITTARVERVPFRPQDNDANDDDDNDNDDDDHDPYYNPQSTLDSVSLGQAVFYPDNVNNNNNNVNDNNNNAKKKIAFTCFDAGGMKGMSRRLGMVFCRNRPSQVYEADITQLLERLALLLLSPTTTTTTTTTTMLEDKTEENEKQDKLSCPCQCISSEFALARSPRYIPSLQEGVVKGEAENAAAAVLLVFLGNKQGFASHDGCMGLYSYYESSSSLMVEQSTATATTTTTAANTAIKIKELIPIISRPLQDGPKVPRRNDDDDDTNINIGMGFPGIFTGDLPLPCAIPGTQTLLLGTLWGSVTRLLQVDVVTGQWNLIDFEESHPLASHSLLCQILPTMEGDDKKKESVDIIITESTSNLPARLWKLSFPKTTTITTKTSSIATAPGVVKAKATKLPDLGSIACTDFSPVQANFQPAFDVQLISIPPPPPPTTAENSKDDDHHPADDERIQAIVLIPHSATKTNKVPLVVVPHGGPHSASTSSYVPGFAFLASRCAVLLPNYRGSIGFGQEPLTSLLTRIGRQDVDDVMACTKHVLQRQDQQPFSSDRIIDDTRVAICGGSHGGFLTAHCTSQYPSFFRAAVMRNPVTNIASMVTATDISDWCYAECLGYTLNNGAIFRGPTKEELSIMYDKSPIANLVDDDDDDGTMTANKMKTPTLIALGLADLRVPPSQGKE